MSLYNMLFGFNPYARMLLKMLNVDVIQIPRFRDCFLNTDGVIVIFTRTGGGNREYYENATPENPEGPWNSDLRKLRGYLGDEDDSYDGTYAHFFYKVPEEYADMADFIKPI